MDEISELLYHLLATILVCIGLSIVLLHQENLSDIQELAKIPDEKVSFSKYGFGPDKSLDMVSGDEVCAHIMSNQTCDIYIDDIKIATGASDMVKTLSNITAEYFSVDYQYDEDGRITAAFYHSGRRHL